MTDSYHCSGNSSLFQIQLIHLWISQPMYYLCFDHFYWDMALCSLVEVDQHFRGAYCLHHHCHEYALPSNSEALYHIS
jgi:hypothetical protein